MDTIGGIIKLLVNGRELDAKDEWTYNLGADRSEAVMGSNGKVHGDKLLPQVPMMEGKITDRAGLDLKGELLSIRNATVILVAGNGKQIVGRGANFAGEGNVTTDEGEIACKFECLEMVEVPVAV